MSNSICKCNVRMYTMGTGDCFVLSFFNQDDEEPQFKLMIDCGVKSISRDNMQPYAENIIEHTGGEVDALVITHEHKDHVVGFERAAALFTSSFRAKEVWFPWTEELDDELVVQWRDEYGKKKKSLAMAASMLAESKEDELFNRIYGAGANGVFSLATRKKVADHLMELSNLNTEPFAANGDYKGDLKGMRVVREDLEKDHIRILKTGKVMENINGLNNVRIYVLGPPKSWDDVKTEHGKDGETYKHNKELELVRGFSSLPFEDNRQGSGPFDRKHIAALKGYSKMSKEEREELKLNKAIKATYEDEESTFRRIDYDWLMSAANLALRTTRGVNNLSAVLAIEFIESGKVMLFPGDAEYGSWRTWHDIEWHDKGKDGETHLTTDLLNRTVFYKVAHHLSHNGTAKEEGLDLMISKELVAMATLDYDVIHTTWRNTMPNRALVKDLLNKTKGRLIISNTKGLHYDKAKKIPLADEIEKRQEEMSREEREAFEEAINREELFVDFMVNGV